MLREILSRWLHVLVDGLVWRRLPSPFPADDAWLDPAIWRYWFDYDV